MRVSGATAVDDEPAAGLAQLVALLDQVAQGLSHGTRRTRLTFPRYHLVRWFWQRAADDAVEDDPDREWRTLRGRLRGYISRRFGLDTADVQLRQIHTIPWWVQAAAKLPLAALFLVWLVWRPLRWLNGRRLGTAENVGRFVLQFRGRPVPLRAEEARQLADLAVDAVLEDLRRAYRRGTLLGRGRRRTSYPAVLVDDVGPETVGLELTCRVTEALQRARPGTRPLLFVAAGGVTAGQLGSPGRMCASNAGAGYDAWLAATGAAGGSPVLSLDIPPRDPNIAGLLQELWNSPLPHGRRPATAAAIAVLLAAVLIPAYEVHQGCRQAPWSSNLTRLPHPTLDHQCVGLAPPGFRFFADLSEAAYLTPELRRELDDVEKLIQANNELAKDRPGRVVVVYLSNLTPDNPENYRTELEQLRGVAVLQEARLNSRPIEVRLANAGLDMAHGRVAAEAILDEARENRRLLAVIGLGISRRGTLEAIDTLARPGDGHEVGIPTMGTVLSATELAESNSNYHQVSPTNKRQAEVLARYARDVLGRSRVRVYFSGDTDDLYSRDMKDQAIDAFEREGLQVTEQAYSPRGGVRGKELSNLGTEACTLGDTLPFYAGRGQHFGRFVEGIMSTCGREPPELLAGDDVGGFVLDGALRPHQNLVVHYVSFASHLIWGASCDDARLKSRFYDGYRALFGHDTCARQRDGHAILAYDALLTVIAGVENVGLDLESIPSRDAVLGGINAIRPDSVNIVTGASGDISFRPGSSEPADKAVLVLTARGDIAPRLTMLCGGGEHAGVARHEACPAAGD
ncbi:MAG TPA: hypothetical protein VGD67_17855 [Pseudonocardiaceae bacterium]